MVSTHFRTLSLAAIALAASCGAATAQPSQQPGAPPAQSAQVQICHRLEQQLAGLEGRDPGRAEQTRRYEEAANRQQAELDRAVAQSRRLGCQSLGFFNLFGGANAQCAPLDRQIAQMRANLDKIMSDLQRQQGSGFDYARDGQRRALLAALSRNDCGPQYRQAAQTPQNPGFFDTLFGRNNAAMYPPGMTGGDSYRTLCVRTCDGYYFPISFSTSSARFDEDARTCHRMCPAAEVILFSHRNPGETVQQAVSLGGRFYTELPNAFKYRQEYNAACSCKNPGETWAETMKGLEDRSNIRQGDIIVTEDRAKALSAPRDARGRPIKPDLPSGHANGQSAGPDSAAAIPAEEPKSEIRTVGPQLGPVR